MTIINISDISSYWELERIKDILDIYLTKHKNDFFISQLIVNNSEPQIYLESDQGDLYELEYYEDSSKNRLKKLSKENKKNALWNV